MNKLCVLGFVFLLGISGAGFAQQARVNIEANPKITSLMKLQAKMVKNSESGRRYCVQLGSFSSRKKAKKAESRYRKKHSRWPIQIKYETPNYKVWVGHFISRLAAERAFMKLKTDFKSAFVFKP